MLHKLVMHKYIYRKYFFVRMPFLTRPKRALDAIVMTIMIIIALGLSLIHI